jgi:hypothetical protein
LTKVIDVTFAKTVTEYSVEKFRENLAREIGDYYEGLDLILDKATLRLRDDAPGWIEGQAIHLIYDGLPRN